ncbi:MAG: Gfo/Idh/MocA family oxidoreductase [Lachnospiraceae bacterium]|nr:Gfo/Idh/MocA family oxidoreductase [Lachnospiraceae bacterium]
MRRTVNLNSDGATGIGIIGSGRSARAFAEAIRKVEGLRLNVVYDPDISGMGNLSSVFPDSILTDNITKLWENCQAVCIAVPSELHVPYIKASLSESKHVLCESPISMTGKYASDLFKSAMEKDLILMESMPCLYNEAYLSAIAAAKSGKIGRIMDVESSSTRLTPTNLRELLDADYGGSMTELGSLALTPIITLLGTSYNSVSFHSLYAGNGVDSYTKAYFNYGKASATVKVGLQVKSAGSLLISGTKGYILLPSPWWTCESYEIHTGEPSEIETVSFKQENSFNASELKEFHSRLTELRLFGFSGFSNDKQKAIKSEQSSSIATASCLEHFLKERFSKPEERTPAKEMQIWAHRGCSYRYPENTLEAFRAAAEIKGLTGIEMDVQMTRDGEIVVIHDENVRRTADGYRDVKDYKLSEIRALRVDRSYIRTTIPTLEEVLRLLRPYCRRTGLLINIELKTNNYRYEGIEEKVVSIVKKLDIEKYVIYSSSLTDSIKKIKEIDKKSKTAVISELLEDCINKAKASGADAMHPCISGLNVKLPKYLKNLRLRAWNTDEPFYGENKALREIDFSKYAEFGVTDIFTNVPENYLKRKTLGIDEALD